MASSTGTPGATRKVRVVYEIDGVTEAVTDQESLDRALQATGEALAEQATQVGAVETKLDSLSDVATRTEQHTARLEQQLQGFAAGLSTLSGILGTESEAGAVLGRMSHMASLGLQLGSIFGPGGQVVGGIGGAAVSAITSLFDALTPVPPAIREVTTEADASARAVVAMGDAFDGAGDRMRQFVNDVSTAARGRGLQDVNAQITEISDRIAALSSGQGSALDRLELPGLRDRLSALTFESQQGQSLNDEEQGDIARGRRRSGSGRRERDPFRSDGGAALRGLISDADAGGADAIGFARGLGGDSENELAKIEERDQAEKDSLRSIARIQEQNHQAQLRRIEEQTEAWGDAGTKIGGVISGAFTSAIQGQEDFGVAVVKGFKSLAIEFGGQMIAEGVGALFTAIGSTVLNPPAAATKAAEGAGKIALGVSLGAAGAAIPVPAAGGGGAQAKPPRLGGGSGASDGGGGSVVVNMNAPAVISGTGYEVGRQLDRQLRNARQRFGGMP